MKIIPTGMTFEQALRAGYAGRIELRPYLDWLKTLPCDTCQAAAPSDPSHYNGMKGMGTKSPDLWAIPHCRSCHDRYERGPAEYVPHVAEDECGPPFLTRAALYLLQAFAERRLVWLPIDDDLMRRAQALRGEAVAGQFARLIVKAGGEK